MKYSKLIAVLCVLAVLTTFTFVLLHRPKPAYADIEIWGQVTSSGNPVQGRTVRVWNLSPNNCGGDWGDNLEGQDVTNQDGYYSVPVDPGSIWYIVEDGCQTYCVRPSPEVRQDFTNQCFK